MNDWLLKLRKFWPDSIFIGLPAAGAIACWKYGLPAWMLVVCLTVLVIAVVSFLGDLGVFGGEPDD